MLHSVSSAASSREATVADRELREAARGRASLKIWFQSSSQQLNQYDGNIQQQFSHALSTLSMSVSVVEVESEHVFIKYRSGVRKKIYIKDVLLIC